MEDKTKDIIVCRCEEVTEAEIRDAIRAGARSVVEIKRWTRAGMGICQGRSCRRLVGRILAEELGHDAAWQQRTLQELATVAAHYRLK